MGKQRAKNTRRHTALLFIVCFVLLALVLIAAVVFVFPDFFNKKSGDEPQNVPNIFTKSEEIGEEIRGIYIATVGNLNYPSSRGLSSDELTAELDAIIDSCISMSLNTVIFQVRPASDAFYYSDIFPSSAYITGVQGEDPDVDILAELVDRAHKEGIAVFAWVNPLRVQKIGAFELAQSNPALLHPEYCVEYSGTLYYNPGIPEVRELIAAGCAEIAANYEVDGILFDDYFYPYPVDGAEYDDSIAYQKYGDGEPIADWRRENVTKLLRQVSAAVASHHAVFGVSPQARMDINYGTQYADIRTWVAEGLVDYLCPQIYFGFSHATQPFAARADEWEALIGGTGIDLYVGLGAYKCGVVDSYAGAGKNEWVENTDILAQMVSYSRGLSGYGGFVLYRYDSFFSPDSASTLSTTEATSSYAYPRESAYFISLNLM